MTNLTSEEQSLMRRRVFRARNENDIVELVGIARGEKFTGAVSIHMSQGAIATATMEERAKLNQNLQVDKETT